MTTRQRAEMHIDLRFFTIQTFKLMDAHLVLRRIISLLYPHHSLTICPLLAQLSFLT